MSDPRADNCKGYHLGADGRVDGVLLDYVPVPQGRFELKSVALIPESQAGGNTIATAAVYDKEGIPCEAPVYLGWPWQGALPLANHLLPGNPNRPVQHVIANGYPASAGAKGPLAIYVGNSSGQADSDVVGGLGLPDNRHVCYSLVFKERGSVTPPVEPPTDPPVEPPTDDGTLATYLAGILAELKKLNAHLGAG